MPPRFFSITDATSGTAFPPLLVFGNYLFFSGIFLRKNNVLCSFFVCFCCCFFFSFSNRKKGNDKQSRREKLPSKLQKKETDRPFPWFLLVSRTQISLSNYATGTVTLLLASSSFLIRADDFLNSKDYSCISNCICLIPERDERRYFAFVHVTCSYHLYQCLVKCDGHQSSYH